MTPGAGLEPAPRDVDDALEAATEAVRRYYVDPAGGKTIRTPEEHQRAIAGAVLAVLVERNLVVLWDPAWGDPERHVVDADLEAWSILHPLRCRAAMLDCAVHHAVALEARLYGVLDLPGPPGRYLVDLNEVGEPIYVPLGR